MQFHTSPTLPLDWSGEVLALGVYDSEIDENGAISGTLAQLDDRLEGAISDVIRIGGFKGQAQTLAMGRVGRHTPVQQVMLLGLGAAEKLNLETLRLAAAQAAKQGRQLKANALGLALPLDAFDGATAVEALVEGIILGTYRDDRFRSEPDPTPDLESLTILGCEPQPDAIEKAQILCNGVILARQLVAAPANVVTPITLTETVQTLAQDYGLDLEILEQGDCEARGMGSFLGVARASDLPPKFIHLTYRPEGTPRKRVAIVGKGLTFDSGGLNIKVAGGSMEMMKTDMGGAGAVFGAAQAIAALKPAVEVHFISAVTENMISGRAMRPGDVLTASNGKTIEVNNTDAEGRLTLADALVFAEELGVDAIVDLATLTGACVIALGNNMAGLWSSQDELANSLLQASERSGDPLWRMPLESGYFEQIKSPIADLKNTGGRAGGSITAALFLQQFVKETPWAHLDVAGPVWTDKDRGYHPSGATGYGVRLLVQWVLSLQ